MRLFNKKTPIKLTKWINNRTQRTLIITNNTIFNMKLSNKSQLMIPNMKKQKTFKFKNQTKNFLPKIVSSQKN